MAEFNIRSDAVDVEQIMRQIRARIQEKRGVDYTEDQIRELATVRLEKFLDPKNLRSDLLEQFRKSRPPMPTAETVELPYAFDDQTLFATHRPLVRFLRTLLRPILALFFNPNTLNQVIHRQNQFNGEMIVARAEWNALYYEVLHNLVLETTRTGIEVRNLKMRVESLSSRLDFSERRVRALEGVVQYRPEAVRGREVRAIESEGAESPAAESAGPRPLGEGARRRRRRRRGGRRGPGLGPTDATGQPPLEGAAEEPSMGADNDPAEGMGDESDFSNEPDSDADGPDEQ